MELKKIINVLAQNGLLLSVHNCGEMNISSISCDSRRVNKGALFFVKGVGFKPEYLYKAFELGAVCYVAENEAKAYDQENIKEIKNTDTAAAVQGRKENSDISDGKGKAPFIRVSSVRKAMPIVADLFYNSPARKYMLTGITGTKGKTTVTYMLKNIFSTAFSEDKTGIISTNEALCGSKSIEKTGTTPEALELYGILNDFSENGIKAACMAVSYTHLA